MDAVTKLLHQHDYGDHQIAGLLLRNDTSIAVLPLETLPVWKRADPELPPLDNKPQSRNFLEWCQYRGISRAMGYRLLKQGRGPRILSIGSKRLVTHEADVEWVSRMQQENTPQEAASS